LIALLVALFLASTLPAFAADKDAKTAPKTAAPAAAAKADDKVDINRAKAEELMKLDGIGDARAKAIIKGRPYKGKDDLVAKNIIPQAVYDKISDQIIAKQK
jgi:DNA uptake protein ComE-like DNA-binding protein